MMKKLITIIFQLLFFAIAANAQFILSGRVSDSITGESLAFVNIVYNKANQGTTTDLDGYFNIESHNPIKILCVSYLGYRKDSIYIDNNIKNLNIKLTPDVMRLDEVTIFPGVNPAHRIINLVQENKEINRPEALNSFSYVSYNKFHATFDLADIPIIDTTSLSADSIKIINQAADSVSDSTVNSLNRAKQLLDKQHLLLMESVSKRKFKKPDKNKYTKIGVFPPSETIFGCQPYRKSQRQCQSNFK
ncbi:MAG TPA: carboxypeptidase-like regulatory domain-containing protein [Bacteroidales bacterium]|nr:carboxypeptidase-like regulatory domain-containing protein [Bacteroidales bacterium]